MGLGAPCPVACRHSPGTLQPCTEVSPRLGTGLGSQCSSSVPKSGDGGTVPSCAPPSLSEGPGGTGPCLPTAVSAQCPPFMAFFLPSVTSGLPCPACDVLGSPPS